MLMDMLKTTLKNFMLVLVLGVRVCHLIYSFISESLTTLSKSTF